MMKCFDNPLSLRKHCFKLFLKLVGTPSSFKQTYYEEIYIFCLTKGDLMFAYLVVSSSCVGLYHKCASKEKVKRKRAGAGKCKEELVTTLCTSTRLFLHQLRSNRRPFSSAVSNTIISADIILQNSCPIQKKMTRQHKRLKLLLGVRKPTPL